MKKNIKIDLEELIVGRIDQIHNSNTTCIKLYEAIESLRTEEVVYHREIVRDQFFDNETLIKEREGKFFLLGGDQEYTKDVDYTYSDLLYSRILKSKEKNVSNINEMIDNDYKRFLLFYFVICIKMHENNNNKIVEITF